MKLYGLELSNYTNIIKQLAIETGIDYELVVSFPGSKEGDFPTVSPAGKIPAVMTDDGPICETRAIVAYIAGIRPDSPLFPKTPIEKARFEEIISIADNYIEAPARRHLPELFFKGPKNEAAYGEVKHVVEIGLKALAHKAVFAPHILGENFSAADIYVFYCLELARSLMLGAYQWDIADAVDGLGDWMDMMAAKDITSKVLAEQAADRAKFA